MNDQEKLKEYYKLYNNYTSSHNNEISELNLSDKLYIYPGIKYPRDTIDFKLVNTIKECDVIIYQKKTKLGFNKEGLKTIRFYNEKIFKRYTCIRPTMKITDFHIANTKKGIILNDKLVENLYSQLRSKDIEINKLAYSIIESCNFSESKEFLLKLRNFNYGWYSMWDKTKFENQIFRTLFVNL